MKYILRVIASIPALCVGISMLFLFTLSFDYPLCILLVIGDAIGMMELLSHFEALVRELKEFIETMLEKTLYYEGDNW